jgi:G:T-mismatch repair DNA endonuclease (very short patch repair protein)
MPTGCYIHRTAESGFVPERRTKYLAAFIWLDWVSRTRGIFLTHALNSGREVKVMGRKVDGYHHESKTIYQFHGCWWHGHSCLKLDPKDLKKAELVKRRRTETERADRKFQESDDYSLVIMYECEFRRQLLKNRELKDFFDNWDPLFKKKKKKKKLQQHDVLEAIADGRLFGVAVVTVSLPSTWTAGAFSHPVLSPREYFEMFPPIFQNRLVAFDDVGAFMQKRIRERQFRDKMKNAHEQYRQRCRVETRTVRREELLRIAAKITFTKPAPRRLLVSVLGSSRLVVTTPLVQWYLSHGLNVTVLEMLQYKPEPCFASFVQMVTSARQSGSDVQARTMKVIFFFPFYIILFFDLTIYCSNFYYRFISERMIANLSLKVSSHLLYFQLLGNSGYGSLLLNRSKYRKVKYARGDSVALVRHLNDPYLKKVEEMEDGLYELEMKQQFAVQNLPTALGVHVLSQAKRYLLEFVYDHVDVLLNRCDFRLLTTDTDSIYLALASSDFDKLVRPESRDLYRRQLYEHHFTAPDRIQPGKNVSFFPRRCCEPHRALDLKTPLFFKMEFSGKALCCLNSKTYVGRGADGEELKISCKGLQKRKLVDNVWRRYMNVLKTNRPDGTENISFRSFLNVVYTYRQKRLGLSAIYTKMIVGSDGISTSPLNLQ